MSKPTLVFAICQSGHRANGGIKSITNVIERIEAFQPLIVTQRATEANDRWRRAGCTVQLLPHRSGEQDALGIVGKSLQLLRNNAWMSRLVRETGCRVLHCNDSYMLMQTSLGARYAGASVVMNMRDTWPHHQKYADKWRVLPLLYDRLLVLSREMRTYFIERLAENRLAYTGDPANVEYIYSIVDLEKNAPVHSAEEREALRERLGITPGAPAIGYVASFKKNKAQLPFIEHAGPRLLNELGDGAVHFLGDFDPGGEPYARRCLEAARRNGFADVCSFEGFVENISDWYKALDLVVLATETEGMARGMIESLANGTPVVSFDVCSAREILEGHGCGRVVAHGDYPALCREVKHLIEDSALRESLGEAGARTARDLFQADEVVAQYESLYSSLSR